MPPPQHRPRHPADVGRQLEWESREFGFYDEGKRELVKALEAGRRWDGSFEGGTGQQIHNIPHLSAFCFPG